MIISNSVDAISYIVLDFYIMRRAQWNGKWPFFLSVVLIV